MRELVDEANVRTLEMGGGGEARRFTMKADGWLFRNLMGGLYSDKIGSVLREIVSNAIDAHAMARRLDVAVQVQLPSAFDPTFAVRDFGDSMDEKFVMELYSCVGHSEKRGTNVATGMFGLGSKSPFAVTDAFEVWTYRDGIRTVYAVFYDVDGTPLIKQQGAYPTDEPNGTCVRVPVSNDKVREFEAALKKNAFAYYDKNVVFSRKLTGDMEESMETVRRSVIEFVPGLYQLVPTAEESRGRSYAGGVFIRQGTAIYPFEDGQLSYETRTQTRRKVLEMMQKGDNAVLFDVPLGTFNVTPSREAISYDAPSVANLQEVYSKCVDAAGEKLAACIASARTYGQAYKNVLATYDVGIRADLKTWKLAADVVKFGEPTIRRNHAKWIENNGLAPDEHILTATRDIIPTFVSPTVNCMLYAGSMSVDWQQRVVGNFDKATRFQTSWPTLGFVIPHNLRDWERRVKAWIAHNSPVKIYQNDGASLPVIVVRCKMADVGLVATALREMEGITAVLSDASKLPEVPDDDKTIDTAVKRKRYSRNAVFKWAGSSWGDGKHDVDFSEPAYYVVRNGSHHDNTVMTEAEKATFMTGLHWHDLTGPTTEFFTTGIRPRSFAPNATLAEIYKLAILLGLVDASLPLYRLTPLQAARLADMDEGDCELSPLFPTIVQGATALRSEFVQALITNEYDTDGYYSVTGYMYNAYIKARDGTALDARIKPVIEKLFADDTFMVQFAMYLIKKCPGAEALPTAVYDSLSRNKQAIRLINEVFTNTTSLSIAATKTTEDIAEKLKGRFSLVAERRMEMDMMPQLLLYIGAVMDNIEAPVVDMSALPFVPETVAHARKLLTTATYETCAAK